MANLYYSGQGSLYVAERNADGTPKGFLPLGNVPTFEISVEVTKFEHKESESGARAVDLSIVQEKKGTFTMTLENLTIDNLATAFWGSSAVTAAVVAGTATVTAYVHADTYDYRIPLPYPAVDTVVLKDSGETITYELGTSEGDTVNSLNGWVDEAGGSIVIFNTAKQTSRGAANNIADLDVLHITSYNAGASSTMYAFTQDSLVRYLRFEGINTVDTGSGTKRLIVNMFKSQLDPLTGYGLINEELGSLQITGNLLYDELQTGTSKFFEQINET